MKFEKNDRYFTLSIYIILTSLIIVIGTLAIFNIKSVWHFIWSMIEIIYWLFKPLIYGIVIAYLMDPIVEFYEKRCKYHYQVRTRKERKKERWHKRTVPTLLAFITLFMFIGVFVLLIMMNLQEISGKSFSTITESLNNYMNYFESMLLRVTQFTEDLKLVGGGNQIIAQIYGYINSFVIHIYNKILGMIGQIGSLAANVLLALVVAFYLLQDKVYILAFTQKFTQVICSKKVYRQVEVLGKDIDYVFSGYIRGQIIDALIVAVLTSVALTSIQLDFAIIIGLVAGLFNLIPYFGPIVGFILAGIIGLLDPNPMKALYGMIAILIIQQIDGWIIVPKVVGECVKLHPVLVLLAILIGGNLFGIIGMLIGVPVAAFIRFVLLRYMTRIFPDGKQRLKEEDAEHRKEK